MRACDEANPAEISLEQAMKKVCDRQDKNRWALFLKLENRAGLPIHR